jgi:hypothetical protein
VAPVEAGVAGSPRPPSPRSTRVGRRGKVAGLTVPASHPLQRDVGHRTKGLLAAAWIKKQCVQIKNKMSVVQLEQMMFATVLASDNS